MSFPQLSRPLRLGLLLPVLGLLAERTMAVTFEFEWGGDAGYSAVGTFSYDAATAPSVISESGAGPTSHLQSLSVEFFDPSRNSLQSFQTVSGGVSQSPYFQFNFDTTTSSLVGGINVGGGTGVIGERFFLGTLGGLLTLRQDVDQQGASNELDRQNPGVIRVSLVPEPEPLAGAGLVATMALLIVGLSRRRNPEWCARRESNARPSA